MASLKKLASIPSLSQLYRAGTILASNQPDLPTANNVLNDKICTIQYDITKLEVDAIVNAANSRLLGGGGVDGAIHRAAGSGLYRECKGLDGCKTGSAKITGAYDLPCKKVVHAVGPIYDSQEESEPLLRGCYRTALQLAAENDCKSIAFSAISTGIYGYPSDDAAGAALDEVRKFLEKTEEGSKIDKVIFCNFMQKDVNAYEENMPKIFPPTEEDATKNEDTSEVAQHQKSDEKSEAIEKGPNQNSSQIAPTALPSTTSEPSLQTEMAGHSTVPAELLPVVSSTVSTGEDLSETKSADETDMREMLQDQATISAKEEPNAHTQPESEVIDSTARDAPSAKNSPAPNMSVEEADASGNLHEQEESIVTATIEVRVKDTDKILQKVEACEERF